MNATEITALLAVCSSFDSRKPNPETIQAWRALREAGVLP